jgi:hypothetical protein
LRSGSLAKLICKWLIILLAGNVKLRTHWRALALPRARGLKLWIELLSGTAKLRIRRSLLPLKLWIELRDGTANLRTRGKALGLKLWIELLGETAKLRTRRKLLALKLWIELLGGPWVVLIRWNCANSREPRPLADLVCD